VNTSQRALILATNEANSVSPPSLSQLNPSDHQPCSRPAAMFSHYAMNGTYQTLQGLYGSAIICALVTSISSPRVTSQKVTGLSANLSLRYCKLGIASATSFAVAKGSRFLKYAICLFCDSGGEYEVMVRDMVWTDDTDRSSFTDTGIRVSRS